MKGEPKGSDRQSETGGDESARGDAPAGASQPVPRLPRGKGFHLRFAQLLRIGVLGALLVAIAVLGRPCADGVSDFIVSFGPPPGDPEAAGSLAPGEVRRLTDEEIREHFPALVDVDGGVLEADAAGDGGPGSARDDEPSGEGEPR